MDSPETQATLGTRHRTPQEWTVQRHRQHWVQDTGHRQHWVQDTGHRQHWVQDTGHRQTKQNTS
jgi:hypothetical protein